MKKLFFFILSIGFIQPAFAQTAKAIDSKLQELKNQLAAAKHDTTRMMALVDISFYYDEIEPQRDSSLLYAQKAGKIAERYPNYPKIAKVWNWLGVKHKNFSYNYINKKYHDVQYKHYLQKAMHDAKRLGNEEYLIKAWTNFTLFAAEQKNKFSFYKNAFEITNYIEAKPALNAIDSLMLGRVYLRICVDLDYDMNSELYKKYFLGAKKMINKDFIMDKEGVIILEFEQQCNLLKKSDEKQVVQAYQQLKQTLTRPEIKEQLEYLYAQYYFNVQEYKKSFRVIAAYIPNLVETKEENKSNNLVLWGMKYLLMGKNAYKLHRNNEALIYLNKALSFLQKTELNKALEYEKYQTLFYLSEAYQQIGNFQKAYSFLKKANKQYEDLQTLQTQALMAANEVNIEKAKQDKKVQEAQTQTLLKEQEANLQKQQKNIFIIISIVALLSFAWAVFSFLKKKKLSETLAEQNIVIKEQAQSLAESNRLKDRIFALLGHDLRAPINRLIMSINQSTDKQSDIIQPALKGVQDTLNNVLYWSSMEIKGITPVYTTMPLKTVVESLVEEYKFDLTDKEITFLNAIDKTINIKADENYLKIILRNLINNAIKFTNPKGYIQIDCTVKDTLAEISLKDTGIGIPPDKIESIFNLPMPSLGTKREKGTGLGLSLSQGIAQKLNGDIQIKSQVGKGTQVRLTLPV